MKVLADSETEKSKLVLIGINKAGQQLVTFAQDLGLRIDVFRLEANPVDKIHELIARGEEALSVKITQKDAIATRAQGSFQIAQLLCHKLCILAKVIETCAQQTTIDLSLDVVIEDVMVDLGRQFKEVAVTFARGFTLRREGRAPYLHMLKWLAESDEWSLDLSEALRRRPEHKASISQVLDKGYLEALLRDDKRAILEPHFHFEPSTSILSVEDPKLIFTLRTSSGAPSLARWASRRTTLSANMTSPCRLQAPIERTLGGSTRCFRGARSPRSLMRTSSIES
jgi:hypothetical protein